MATGEPRRATLTISDLARSALRCGYTAARRRLSGYGLPRFRVVRSAERLVRAALRTDATNVLGHRMRLDANDRGELSINGIYEPLTTDLVRRENIKYSGPDDAPLTHCRAPAIAGLASDSVA